MPEGRARNLQVFAGPRRAEVAWSYVWGDRIFHLASFLLFLFSRYWPVTNYLYVGSGKKSTLIRACGQFEILCSQFIASKISIDLLAIMEK